MARIIIYPYNMGSASARALQDGLNRPTRIAKRVRPDGDYVPRLGDVVVNWGSGRIPDWAGARFMLNHPTNVASAGNKLTTLQQLMANHISTVEWTTDMNVAARWINEGFAAICRTLLRSHSGGGIIIARTHGDLVEAPLYTKYKKKKNEYRVHVFNGNVIDVQEKRKATEFERDEDQALIRSHQNGWNFCREDIEHQPILNGVALDTIRALGLDFGAVDIIYNRHDDAYYVLEVNTAVGLEGTTLDIYKRAIEQHFNNQQQQ
jgi:hypothetical protein